MNYIFSPKELSQYYFTLFVPFSCLCSLKLSSILFWISSHLLLFFPGKADITFSFYLGWLPVDKSSYTIHISFTTLHFAYWWTLQSSVLWMLMRMPLSIVQSQRTTLCALFKVSELQKMCCIFGHSISWHPIPDFSERLWLSTCPAGILGQPYDVKPKVYPSRSNTDSPASS